MTGPRLLRCGPQAVLVELDGLDEVLALADAVRMAASTGTPGFCDVVDVVPAATTVLVTVDESADLAALRRPLARLAGDAVVAGRASATPTETVEVGVRYDGPDLDEVAELTGLTRRDVVAAHVGQSWRVAFGGFAPGFAYLIGGDPRLAVPRRREPRTLVPAGSVALADRFSAVYPRPSPGGWQLLGHTDVVMWDSDREPPALLRPGLAVRFVELAP